MDGKEINVASKELDKLEESGHKSGKGIKATESSMDSLADSSSKASKDVKGTSDSLDDLGDSGSKAGKDVKGAESSVDGLADSSADATKGVKSASDSLDNLGDSGSKASKDIKGTEGSLDGLSDSGGDASKNVKGTSDSLDSMSDSASEAAYAAKKAGDETKGVGEEAEKASDNTKKFAISLGLIAVASAAFVVLKSSMDDAITRFDTLNTFPKVLQALGVSAEDSERAMSRLSDGIDGLPTTLNDIASNAQRMYTSFNDMDKAADSALALNNALLGSGSSAAQASRGTEQYLKSLQTGKMYLSTWNTLSETMDVGLIKIAEGFGFAGKSAKDDLYSALQSGSISMDTFNDKLIEVGTGTGIMAELAKENSVGIATSLGNLKNAAARGIADIIDSFNKLSKAVTGKEIAQNIDSLKHIVNASFKAIGSVIEGTAPILIFFADGVKATIPVVEALTPAIIGLVAAYAAYTVITKASAAIEASNQVLMIAQSSQKALTIATSAQLAVQAASTTATSADVVAKAAQTGAVSLSTLAIGVMTGTISLSTAAQVIGTAASYAFGTAIRFLMGPIGWVVAGLGLLVAGVIAIVKWFKQSSEEAKRLNAETEELSDSTDALIESVDSTSGAYKDNQTEIKATAKANEELAQKVDELSEKENKSAAEKAMLSSYVDQLNESVEGLNLTYNEEADALSMSSEELQARVDLMKEEEAGLAAKERMLEISKEQNEVDMKLAETNELREEWNKSLEDGSVKASEHKEKIEELDEKEQELQETTKELGEQQVITEEQFTTAMENITEATQSGVANQIIAFEDLSESQQATVESMKSTWEDYKAAATDMFDTLSDEMTVTTGEMKDNMLENQRVMSEWADNIAILAERGINEGLLDELREAGPESAGHVKAIVSASDEELKGLNDAFEKGTKTATETMAKGYGIEESGILEAVGSLVTDTEQSLKQQMESADFESIGVDLTDGLAGGVDEGSKNVQNAAENMADDTTNATKDAFGVKSPSTVFKEVGGDLTDGLALGIDSGTSKVIQAIQKMFKSVETASLNSLKAIINNYDGSVKNIEQSLGKLPIATQKSMSDATNRLKTGADAQVNVMKTLSESLDDNFKTIVKNCDKSVEDIDESLKKLPVITQESMNNMLTRLKAGADSNVQVMRTLAINLISPFNNTPSQFETIGRDSMAGLNSGLMAGQAQVMATARSIANSVANTMRNALDIHSPSRVTEKIGEYTAQGLADGIYKKEKVVHGNTQRLADGIIRITKSMNSEVNSETKKANAEIRKIRQGGKKGSAKKIKEIEKKLAEDIIKINEEKVKRIEELNKKEFDNSKKWIDERKYYNELSLTKELEAWERVQARYKKGTEERKEADRQVYRMKNELVKAEFDHSNNWIAKQKRMSNLSLADELEAWERVQARYKKGSKERVDAEENIYRVKKEIHDKLISLNDEYTKKIKDANQKMIDTEQKMLEDLEKRSTDIKEKAAQQELKINEEYSDKILRLKEKSLIEEQGLWDKYTDALKSREQSIYSSFGLFDQVKVSRVSGDRLIKNLETQTKALQGWKDDLTSLESRGIEKGLLEELQALGPDAAGEIKALTKLSDKELGQYTDLWSEKTQLARTQADKEMRGMKQDTINQIAQLRSETAKQLSGYQAEWNAALVSVRREAATELSTLQREHDDGMKKLRKDTAEQLDLYQKEWTDAISKVREGTKNEFNAMVEEMPAIGENVIQGMMDGLDSMTPALMAQAQSIANAVKATMQSALNINSPPGVMRDDVGRWIPEGIALGIRDNAKSVYRELDNLSNNMIMTSTAEQALGTSRMGYSSGIVGGNSIVTNHKDQSRKMENNVTIKTYDSGAKEMERTLRRLQFGL